MTHEGTLTLTIDGMHCGACVGRVTQALSAMPGVTVRDVQVGAALVAYDAQKAGPDAIAAAVNRIGFTVTQAAGRDAGDPEVAR